MGNKKNRKRQKITIVDVARESGVSYSTVSRVLSGFEFVKDSTRQRVLEAVDRLGYVVNIQARSLAGGRSSVIGLLVPTLDNGYINEIARGIDEELAKVDYNLMLYTTRRHRDKESLYVNTVAGGLTDGLILVVPLVPAEYLDALREQNYPYVLIDQSDVTEKSNVVDTTNWQGAYEATKYLIGLGHRRIAFISGLMDLSSAVYRLDGYQAALADEHIPLRDELIMAGDFWQSGGYQAMQRLLALPKLPTAVFAASDLMAFGAMEAIRERGLGIPEDISILGFDDLPQASITHPKLTTVRQPLEQMGRAGVRLLLEQIADPERAPKRLTLATQLIVRDSCRQV